MENKILKAARDRRYNQKPESKWLRNHRVRIYQSSAHVKFKRNKRDRERRRREPMFRLRNSMSALIYHTIQKNKKGSKWESLVGYTVTKLKEHLEKQFTEGMSWENYGKWHIDHILPISHFEFSRPTDIAFKKCWELNNLQPLWAEDNFKKSNKILATLL